MAYIPASEPTTAPAVGERVYDKWWITSLVIAADAPPVANLLVTLRKFRTTETGGVEFGPDAPAQVALSDLLTLAQSDQELAAILGLIYAKVAAVGAAQGVL